MFNPFDLWVLLTLKPFICGSRLGILKLFKTDCECCNIIRLIIANAIISSLITVLCIHVFT